ncbi:MAG: hypothetical protein UEY44_07645 [Coprococcus sp.]|nr:hypothetical protein [Coprococcus sp.]
MKAEGVYSPIAAGPQDYQYNADVFEAGAVDEVKQKATHKEVSKVREDKAR